MRRQACFLYLQSFLNQVKLASLRPSLQCPPTQSSSPALVCESYGGEPGASPRKKGWSLTPVPPGVLHPVASWGPCKVAAAVGPVPLARSGGEGREHFRIRSGRTGASGAASPSSSPAQAPQRPLLPALLTETHLCLRVPLAPSRVKGEAPVSSSKSRMPRLHQSTACRAQPG